VLRRNPFVLSGLVLAQPEAKQADGVDNGILTAEAIAAMDGSKLELVMLSACDTACGEQQIGDGIFGLQCAFHVAGARNVIASLWKIDDEATREFMTAFYERLWKKKLSPIQALRDAQLEMLQLAETGSTPRGPRLGSIVRRPNASSNSRRSPIHWAGFVLSGSGQ
jgi:CHAT domain-containing protein